MAAVSSFLKAQLDYVFFFYGFAFIFLAVVCMLLRNREEAKFPWGWLALFGLLHGINEWIDLVLYVLGKNAWLSALSLGFMTLSFLCLFEFGRRGWALLKGKTVGRWIYIPLLCLGALGAIKGLNGLNASLRYALGFTGALLSAWVLFILPCPEKIHRRYLRVSAAALFLYAFATGLVVPKADFFPAAFLNMDLFLNLATIPVQLLRGLLAIVVAVGIFNYYMAIFRDKFASLEERSLPFYSFFVFLILFFSLLGGWLITEKVSRNTESMRRRDLLMRVKTISAALNPQRVAILSGDPADSLKPDFKRLKEQLAAIRQENSDCRFLYLMGYKKEQVVFLLDSESEDSLVYSPPGHAYGEASPELKSAFLHGQVFIKGPYVDRRGNWVTGFAPVYDNQTGKLLALVGMDIKAATWKRLVALSRFTPVSLTAFFFVIITVFLFGYFLLIEFSKVSSASERRFRALFADSPLPLYELDLSAIKDFLDGLRTSGVNDFDGYFVSHPEEIVHCLQQIKINDANQKTWESLGVASKEELVRGGLARFFVDLPPVQFKDVIVKLAAGYLYFDSEIQIRTLTSEVRQGIMRLSVVSGYEHTLGKVIISFIDITLIKASEIKLKDQIDFLEKFNKAAVDRELKMVELKKRIKELEGR